MDDFDDDVLNNLSDIDWEEDAFNVSVFVPLVFIGYVFKQDVPTHRKQALFFQLSTQDVVEQRDLIAKSHALDGESSFFSFGTTPIYPFYPIYRLMDITLKTTTFQFYPSLLFASLQKVIPQVLSLIFTLFVFHSCRLR